MTLNENSSRTRAARTVTTYQSPYDDPRTRTRIAMASHVAPTTCGVLPGALPPMCRHKLQQGRSSDYEGDVSDRAEHASDRGADGYYAEPMEADPGRLCYLSPWNWRRLPRASGLGGSNRCWERHTGEHREDFTQRPQQPLSRS